MASLHRKVDMPSMTGAQALVRSLAREGVRVVFSLPGTQLMTVLDALYEQSQIRLVTVRHEQATTYMADGYARTSGEPGVAMVVPGPGVLNAMAGLGTAYAVSSPVLLISGQVERAALGQQRGALHEVHNQLEVFQPITKWSALVTRAEELPGTIHTALYHLKTGRPRPVVLEVPWDVLSDSAEVELLEPELFPPEGPEEAQVREAARLLSEARRPLLWAGGGVIAADASQELTELAERLRAPVITTPEGKGAIPEDHPLSLGVFYYGHGPGHQLLPEADVVLAVGSRLYFPLQVSWAFQPYQSLIQVNADPADIGRTFPAKVGIAADARVALRAILKELDSRPVRGGWRAEELAQVKDETLRRLQEMGPQQMEFLEVLRQELAEDAILVGDATLMTYWGHLAFPVLRPRSYLTTSYFATLGSAFPTALGAKVANPQRQVVAICGDGGFLYNAQELATAVHQGLSVVALVFNNHAYGSTLHTQQQHFGNRVIGTTLHNPDFVRLAESFGALGLRASSPGELAQALRGALGQELPTVIEVPIPILSPVFHITPPGVVDGR
ncbi:MAG: thiamine pyrophosphate-binding protein [Dehalococcoidia bacterium]